jgi:hypothetical protein
MISLSQKQLNQALSLLGEYLEDEEARPCHLVVCGGAALIACALVSRTTADVDVVALMNDADEMISPDPLPSKIIQGAEFVREALGLPENWLNNGPSRNPGGLFQSGLPSGMAGRLTKQDFGEKLSVYFLSRYDQIHLKLYAATDSGPGRHVDDFLKLAPKEDEVSAAALWALTQDASDGFRLMLSSMLKQLGFKHVADRL